MCPWLQWESGVFEKDEQWSTREGQEGEAKGLEELLGTGAGVRGQGQPVNTSPGKLDAQVPCNGRCVAMRGHCPPSLPPGCVEL